MEKKRVLVVDDEPRFTRMLKLNLEKTGLYEVGAETKGTRVLDSARAFHPHLILLDVVMPDVDGGDIAQQIRTDDLLKGVPIIFLTAVVSRKETRTIGTAHGGFVFLSKTISLNALIECIEKHLQ